MKFKNKHLFLKLKKKKMKTKRKIYIKSNIQSYVELRSHIEVRLKVA